MGKTHVLGLIHTSKPRERFNIFANLCYQKAKVVGDTNVLKTFNVGLGEEVIIYDLLTMYKEVLVLQQPMCQDNSPTSLSFKFVRFCTINFLYVLPLKCMLLNGSRFQDAGIVLGGVFEYTPGITKTTKVDIVQRGVQKFYKHVICLVGGIMNTFERIIFGHPTFQELTLHLLFLTPLAKWEANDVVWYSKGHLERNTLGGMPKKMTIGIPRQENAMLQIIK